MLTLKLTTHQGKSGRVSTKNTIAKILGTGLKTEKAQRTSYLHPLHKNKLPEY